MSSFLLGPPLAAPARRVVSLVPSLTEAVGQLGKLDVLVGRSDYCVSPAEAAKVPALGGTKTFDPKRVLEAGPQLVLTAKEENPRRLVFTLAQRVPVLVVDPRGPEDVPALWRELGQVLGVPHRGQELAAEVERELAAARVLASAWPGSKTFVYFVWKDPWMAAGPQTYVSRLLTTCGLVNAVETGPRRYPTLKAPQALAPDVVVHLYPDEPYSFALPLDLSPWERPVVPMPFSQLLASGALATSQLAPRAEGGAGRPEEGCLGEELAPGGSYLLGGRIFCLGVRGAPFTWYPSRTAQGLRQGQHLVRLLTRWLASTCP